MDNSLIILDEIRDGALQLRKVNLMYESALKEMETKINIISQEFELLYKYNPIEHIKTRIKTPESIVKKLKKKGLEVTYKNLVNGVNDVAGIRIICSFIPDIYRMVEMFEQTPDIKVISKKDYIKNPKPSGYSSYHLIVLVPVSFSKGMTNVKVEIQIRTIAMDFWASLEHKIKYKYDEKLPKNISKELIECSKIVNKLDKKMSSLGNNLIEEFDLEQKTVNKKQLIKFPEKKKKTNKKEMILKK